ncbi:hypothetical protein EV702DRAFT_1205261 [Suillus placidus]|uniref:Uncharacterized protein n=1 Tax=Suillus placidus TaxID=48579 RepID=A0A9P7CWI8_9AGAM|nr:hypothetical protein EV702DRAFT_1205261 [Suillus placidus]
MPFLPYSSSPTTAQKSNPIHPAHAQPPPLPVTSDYCNRCKGRHFPRPFLLTPTCSMSQGGTVHNHQQFKWLGITLDTIRTCQRALIPTLLPPACTLLTVAPNPAVLSSPINMPRGTGSSRLKGLSRSILSHSLRGRRCQAHVLPGGKQSQRLEAAASSRRAQFQEMSAEDREMVESMMVDYGMDVDALPYSAHHPTTMILLLGALYLSSGVVYTNFQLPMCFLPS